MSWLTRTSDRSWTTEQHDAYLSWLIPNATRYTVLSMTWIVRACNYVTYSCMRWHDSHVHKSREGDMPRSYLLQPDAWCCRWHDSFVHAMSWFTHTYITWLIRAFHQRASSFVPNATRCMVFSVPARRPACRAMIYVTHTEQWFMSHTQNNE